jgi:hypothetical protein
VLGAQNRFAQRHTFIKAIFRQRAPPERIASSLAGC